MRGNMNSKLLSIAILAVLFVVVVGSVVYTTHLAQELAGEEQKKMQTWAEATEQLILADENTDINFVTSIIEGNTTIPVYMVDKEGRILLTRNVKHPVNTPSRLRGPIEVKISDEIVQYIYYDESTLLNRLRYFPYIQLALIFVFIAISVFLLLVVQRSEQNKVWVGLSKETAHQLGTPISSLNAWQQLLQDRYPEDQLLPEMYKDIRRLETIADRFSKIGSKPELVPTAIEPVIEEVQAYMLPRISKKIQLVATLKGGSQVLLNKPLFMWVLENLIRNAVDAIDREGTITIAVSHDEKYVYVDVTDTGRGIDKRAAGHIFQAGYTTKKRGWGLGLSLAQRIVEDYHRGKLTLKSTQVGKGTTFRIRLKQAIDC